MMNGNLMNSVKVKQLELLVTLQSNLSKHIKDVEEALVLRRAEVLEYFKHTAEKLERDSGYQPKESISFPMPKDNSADYRRAIRMVEMTVDDIIELSEDQFDKLVMDNWHWKQELMRTSALYGKFN